MNETQIRERVREALGEPKYPSSLASSAAARMKRPAAEQHPRAIGLIAALLALAVIAALLGPRLSGLNTPGPAGSPRAESPQSTTSQLVPGDYYAAGLETASALITPFQVTAQTGTHSITLIGAYADPAETVLFFVVNPAAEGPAAVFITDGQGMLNAGGGGGSGLPGRFFQTIQAGPRPGPDGLAHLTLDGSGFQSIPATAGSGFTASPWSFSIALK